MKIIDKINIIKSMIKDSIIDCELELGGLFEKFSKPDENNVCDFSKCYDELLSKFKSEKTIYNESTWAFNKIEVFDHFQQTMIDFLKEKYNIKLSRSKDRAFIFELIDETFDEMMNN